MNPLHELPALDHLALPQLKALRAGLDGLITRREEESRKAALLKIGRLADEAGLSAEVLTQHFAGRKRGRRRAKLPARYRDPDNPRNTWAGRGKRPKWLVSRLAAGARLEDFAVRPETGVQDGNAT